MKIVTKVLLLSAAAVALVTVAGGYVVGQRAEQQTRAQLDRLLGTNLAMARHRIEHSTRQRLRAAEIIARDHTLERALRDRLSGGVNPMLNDTVGVYAAYRYLMVVRPDGMVFATSTRDGSGRETRGEQLLGLDLSGHPLFARITRTPSKGLAEALAPGHDPFLERVGLEPRLTQWFVAPVHVQGEALGWVVIAYDWERTLGGVLTEVVEGLRAVGSATRAAYLLAPEGEVVVADDASGAPERFALGPDDLWREEPLAFGGERFRLVVVNDRDETLRPLYQARVERMVLFVLGGALLLLLLHQLLRRILLRRLELLHRGAEALAGGNLGYRLPPLGGLGGLAEDELGRLGTTFNQMALTLETSFAERLRIEGELRDYQERLEGMVEARTAELDRHVDALAEEKGRLELVLRSTGVGLWDWRVASGEVVFNERWAEIVGYTLEELQPVSIDTWMSLAHPEDLAHSGERLERVFAGECELYECEARMRHKAGHWVWVLDTGRVVERDADGKPLRMIGTHLDITERHRLDRMKSEFVSTVSHELRTPLTSIQGALGLLRGGALGELPGRMGEMIQVAFRNSDRLVRLVNDILDMEKIEAGRMEFQLRTHDLARLIEQALEVNGGYAEKHGVTLRAAPLPVGEARVDADRFAQVMANLLSNAVKFSPRGGEVTVTLGHHGRRLRVEVVDRGRGIPEAFHGRIFDKFAQADGGDGRELGGTGLGLSICKAIVEHLGGEIGFHSVEGEGTRFFFELPALYPSPDEMSPVDGSDRSTGRRIERPRDAGRVLICEDEPDIAELLKLMLEEQGHDCDIALSGAEARARLNEQPYAMMTLDLMLPDEDGLSLLRDLRRTPRGSELPVVVLSADGSRGPGSVEGEALEVIDWLSKPVDEARLRSVVGRFAGHAGEQPRLLHVEDDESLSAVLATLLEATAEVEGVPTLAEARERLTERRYDLALLDIDLPDGSALELVVHAENIATLSAPLMCQGKAHSAGNGESFPRSATLHWRISGAPYGPLHELHRRCCAILRQGGCPGDGAPCR